jgi:hypothetical protein
MSGPKIKIYHYAKLEDWWAITDGYVYDTAPGLIPARSIAFEDPEARNTKAVFGLLKPEPTEWVHNPHFAHIWRRLTRDIGDMLLEIKVDPQKDTVLVGDRGHIEGVLYQDPTGIPQKYLHDNQLEGEHRYMQSLVPLSDYVNHAHELQFSLPEVILPNHVPLEQITVSHQQPLLEGKLRRYPEHSMIVREKLRFINNFDELQPWYTNYQERERELQTGRGTGSKERC